MAPEGTGYLGLEPYDIYWGRVRDMYAPFENGMKSGTARVFDHQIPGENSVLCVRMRVEVRVNWLVLFGWSGCVGACFFLVGGMHACMKLSRVR